MTEKTPEEYETELRGSAKTETQAKEAMGVGVGALAGAGLGAVGGPVGALVGAVAGGVAGGLASLALEASTSGEAAHEEKLDEEIGIASGELGDRESGPGAFATGHVFLGRGSAQELPPRPTTWKPRKGPIPPSE